MKRSLPAPLMLCGTASVACGHTPATSRTFCAHQGYAMCTTSAVHTTPPAAAPASPPPHLQYGTFSAEDACNFALNIYDGGATLSIGEPTLPAPQLRAHVAARALPSARG